MGHGTLVVTKQKSKSFAALRTQMITF